MTLSKFKDKAEEIVKQYIPENVYRNIFVNAICSLNTFHYSIRVWVNKKYIESELCKSPEEALEVFRINMETDHKLRLAKEEFKDKITEDMEITNG